MKLSRKGAVFAGAVVGAAALTAVIVSVMVPGGPAPTRTISVNGEDVTRLAEARLMMPDRGALMINIDEPLPDSVRADLDEALAAIDLTQPDAREQIAEAVYAVEQAGKPVVVVIPQVTSCDGETYIDAYVVVGLPLPVPGCHVFATADEAVQWAEAQIAADEAMAELPEIVVVDGDADAVFGAAGGPEVFQPLVGTDARSELRQQTHAGTH